MLVAKRLAIGIFGLGDAVGVEEEQFARCDGDLLNGIDRAWLAAGRNGVVDGQQADLLVGE